MPFIATAQICMVDSNDPIVSATAPTPPATDMVWLDTAVTPSVYKRWTGTAWEIINDTSGLINSIESVEQRVTTAEQKITSDAIVATVTASTTYKTLESTANNAAKNTETLAKRVDSAEFKLLPDALMTSVKSTELYRSEKYGGRNYALQSHILHSFVNNAYRYENGTTSTATSYTTYLSPDLFEHSGKGKCIRISLDIKRSSIVPLTSGIYSGIFMYYRTLDTDGVTTLTTGRGWYLRSTDGDYSATDGDWVRITRGPLDLSAFAPTGMAYFALGSSGAAGTTGTVQFRNLKLEVGSSYTNWEAAPEDLDNLPGRMSTAESSITQNSNQIALKVSTATYNTEKVYRSTTAPGTYTNALWLDISLTPPILKRWSGSAWVAVGAQEVKTSGISIGSDNVSITTEQFLLQLLDPNDNENVIMEMSANGNVGFKELYADEIISDSVALAYNGPTTLNVNSTFSGTSTSQFRSLGEAVKVVNNKYLSANVAIYLPSSGAVYEPAGVYISGITGPGRLMIYGYSGCTLNSFISIKGCSAHVLLQNITLRESRALNGTNRNGYLVECLINHFVEINGCTLDANNTTYDSVYARSSHVALINTGLYNALQGLEVYLATGVVKNCKGSCSWAMVTYAGLIFANGTVPAGSRSSGENGQLFATNVTVDYGTAIPVVVPDQSTTQYVTLTKSWRGSWRSDTVDVIQGVYSDSGYSSSLNWNRGCMWFGNLKATLSGKTIKSATLTLYRKTGSGASAAKTVYLCAITNTAASGTPTISVNYGAIGTIGRASKVTFSIPVAAVQGLASGTYGGLCLYESSYNFGSSTYSSGYMRMAGTDSSYKPYLDVVYSG